MIEHFRDLGDKKIQVDTDFKMGQFLLHNTFNQCVKSFQGDLVKRLYKVDA